VKWYSRSSADQEEPLPHELRPVETLELAMCHLLHNVIPECEDEDFIGEWYNFMWDRTRSIRKDITQQQMCNLKSVSLLEKCARFHIYCSTRLCELDRHTFDPKLNDENLVKCLQSLEQQYDDLRAKGTLCPSEPEFRAYRILLNLNEGDVLWDVQQHPSWIRNSLEIQNAIKAHHSMFVGNHVAFFRILRQSSYFTSCILHRYLYQVRTSALRSLFRAHSIPAKNETWVRILCKNGFIFYIILQVSITKLFNCSIRSAQAISSSKNVGILS